MSPRAVSPARRARSDDVGPQLAQARADFPALAQLVHGKPLVYLDNAATSHKPRAVLDAIRTFYERDNSNVHRGLHVLSERATAAYEGARGKVARFLNARRKEEIVFVRGTTEAINLVAGAYGRAHLGKGDEVLITGMEHHSNIVPWQLACEASGARLVVAPIDTRGELDLESFAKQLSGRTRMVAVTYVSNALGTVNPVARLVQLAHAQGVPVLVDAAQAVPHLPVDVQALDCDFLAFSGHKLYAPTGIGVLYGKWELLESMPPYQGGGDMILSVTFEKTTYNHPPYRFEAGTPNIAGAIGLGAAIDYVTGLGLSSISAHEKLLLDSATRAVGAVAGVRLIGTARQKASVLSFVMEGIHPHDVGTILDLEGVAVRAGHHCAQPVMERLGIPATVRASFGLYNTVEEIDVLVAGLKKAAQLFA